MSAPRVCITYEVKDDGSISNRELPFVIAVVGDFSAGQARTSFADREVIKIDGHTFDDILAAIHPRLFLKIESPMVGDQVIVDLEFRHMDDFGPQHIAEQVNLFRTLLASHHSADHETLRRYLDSVLHSAQFRELEAAWRNLRYLVTRLEGASRVRTKLLDVSKDEVNPKALYAKLRNESEGAPVSLMVSNYSFTSAAADLRVLNDVAQVAEQLLAPFLAGATPDLIGIPGFDDISQSGLYFHRRTPSARPTWDAFRLTEASRFVGLTAPGLLLRAPYSLSDGPGDFAYTETVETEKQLLFGNAAFALGASIANSFERTGWFRGFIGSEGNLDGGLPTRQLPLPFRSKERLETSSEVILEERADKGLEAMGFIPVLTHGVSGKAMAFIAPSVHKPEIPPENDGWLSSLTSCQFPYILASSRFMHNLRSIGRGLMHLPMDEQERLMNFWIRGYILPDGISGDGMAARHPLGGAEIKLSRKESGKCQIEAAIRPQYLLESERDGKMAPLRILVE